MTKWASELVRSPKWQARAALEADPTWRALTLKSCASALGHWPFALAPIRVRTLETIETAGRGVLSIGTRLPQAARGEPRGIPALGSLSLSRARAQLTSASHCPHAHHVASFLQRLRLTCSAQSRSRLRGHPMRRPIKLSRRAALPVTGALGNTCIELQRHWALRHRS